MEYVDGKTLREIVPVKKMQDAIGYAIQIGEALQEAHSNGIVHRDIKADNIMVNSKNQVKVMDFGLAKLKGSLKLTKTSSTIGTLAYMAPEQIQGEEVDARSDIFSFGVVLYEMLTGHLPFRGEHEAAMVYSIVNEEPEPLQHYRPGRPIGTAPRAQPRAGEGSRRPVPDRPRHADRPAPAEKGSSRLSRQHAPAHGINVPVLRRNTPQTRGSRRKWFWLGGISLVVLCAILVICFFPGRIRRAEPSTLLSRSHRWRGQVGYGSLSKQGNWFVFPARDDSGNWDVYWTSLGGRRTQQNHVRKK